MRLGIATVGLAALIGLAGCSSDSTPTGTPATSTVVVPTHGYVTRDVLVETSPWLSGGTSINPAFVSELDAYAAAGPVHLILSNMSMIPDRMRESGFAGRDNCLWYALSRTMSGSNWIPGSDGELQVLYQQTDAMVAWWHNYLNAVIGVMQTRADVTVTIITEDALDRGGRSLGNASLAVFPAGLQGRVSLGDTVPD